ncbi:iron-containing redox enzyme family protein [Nocardioides dongxiaopingii]|uniref:iron-containing redox enzyme family protein n=1 Tax=Nocardioides sp. S-1144 TaxID=2582905 RepID=UPI001162364D|nr:iron-containing redox enzyme family protein [Nocardioides sp. S-1144]QCW51159.2 iron-containing redox enzyme family protein [Nocardioides sp. S-1144]
MRLPTSRGPLSDVVAGLLKRPVTTQTVDFPVPDETRPDDEAITLWMLHELHYRGFDDVDEAWEWAPVLMPLRHRLERNLELSLRRRFAAGRPLRRGPAADGASDVVADIEAVITASEGRSLARHVQRHASREETLHLLRQRSIYHLKEADPTTWVVPRLEATTKAALVQVQYDEYGVGDPARLHHELFARGLAASGLDRDYGAYIDETLLPVLEQNNALSLFGLHRRLRGAALGHLAVFEATSSVPSRQLAQGLARLEFPDAMVEYYDEHVEADAVHEQLVLHDVCAALVAAEPDQHDEVLFGAWSCLDLEARTAEALLDDWEVA